MIPYARVGIGRLAFLRERAWNLEVVVGFREWNLEA